MANFPFYTEHAHDRGTVTQDSSNAARTTATSNAEGSLKLEVADKIFLLQPVTHPFVTLLTSIGKSPDGKTYKGSGLLKQAVGNPEFPHTLAKN